MIDTRLEGRVTDINGDRLPGVTITITDTETSIQSVRITDADGEYRYDDLSPSSYNLTAELPGFKTYVQDNIIIPPHRTFTLNITLQVAVAE